MSNKISGNMVGSYSPIGKTFILTDENGIELTGVCVDNQVVFTADASTDIREGMVAATDSGVVTGSAIIPNYETSTGAELIKENGDFKITLTMHDMYDYTKLQCLICLYNSSLDNSVATEHVVIGDDVYDVNSTTVVSTVTKDVDSKSIDLNLTNISNNKYVIRYFTYKELY